MIHTLAFNKAVALHHQIVDHSPDTFIVASTNTPVATLVAPVIAPALFYDDQSADYQSVASIASMLERNSVTKEGTDTHDMTLRNFVQLASESIRRTVYLTKTVALPIIEDLALAAENRFNEVTGGSGLALNILVDTQSEILANPTLVNAIEPFQIVAGPNTESVNVHDPRDSAQLVELIRVGYEDFDNEMQAWIGAHLSADIVSNVYHKVFSSAGTSTYMSNVFEGSAENYPEGLICFLLARGLILNPDENINMSAADYDKAMAMVSNYAAITVKRGMTKSTNADKYNRMVLRYPPQGQELSYDRPEQGVIVVNKNVYESFLKEGGSPEVVMGAYLADRETDSTKLIVNRDQYLNLYNARLLKTRSDKRLTTITAMRNHLETALANEIVKIDMGTDDVESIWTGIKLDAVVAQANLRRGIDFLILEDLDDMYTTVRNLVLDVFFSETDVRKLITLIDANSKDHPDDIKGAANVAVVDYIVDWFMHQTAMASY